MAKRLLLWTGADDARLEAALARIEGLECSVAADRAAALGGMENADALVTVVQTWGEDFATALARARIEWLQVLNAGIDPLVRFGLPSGVKVTTVGGAGSASIAEHAVALLLSLMRRGPELFEHQRHGEWVQAVGRKIESLQDQRIAVLGAGHIGSKIATLVKAFGGNPIGVGRAARRDALGFDVVPLAELDAILGGCAAVVVALPLTPDTNRLLDADTLAKLPRGAHVVNISRGRIIDTPALVAALESGALGGAALDVTEPEPLPSNHALWSLPNVIITPHVAWGGALERRQREVDAIVVENARRFVHGEPLRYHVAAPT
jgi:phosphoglycerate dehydrogenase-like enzyme